MKKYLEVTAKVDKFCSKCGTDWLKGTSIIMEKNLDTGGFELMCKSCAKEAQQAPTKVEDTDLNKKLLTIKQTATKLIEQIEGMLNA